MKLVRNGEQQGNKDEKRARKVSRGAKTRREEAQAQRTQRYFSWRP